MNTRERTEEFIKVMQAYMEGKRIECKENGSATWIEVSNPKWYWGDFEYRVKPQPIRLDVANGFFEKTFGIKNAFTGNSCINHFSCCDCAADKEGYCYSGSWWNTPCEEQKGEW